MDNIYEILATIRPEHDFRGSANFVDDGLLDSFDMLILVSELDHVYGISIEAVQIVPENFNNIEAIGQLLDRYGVRG